MSIQVTPIPRLTVLTAPAFTLGTANAAGAANTAIASDSTLLVYDITVPTTIASGDSPAAGDVATAARRNHTHGMYTATVAASEAEMEAGTSTAVFSSPGRAQYSPGVAKGFCRVNGAGVLYPNGLNITSVTATGTGDRTIVWDTDFANTDYAMTVAWGDNGVDGYASFVTYATGSVRLICVLDAGGNTDTGTTQAAFGVQ